MTTKEKKLIEQVRTLKIKINKLQDTLDKKNKTLEYFGIQYVEGD